MVTMEQVIKFLMDMMRDDQKREAFNADPADTLAGCGLSDVTPRDISDAETVMRDSGLAQPRGGGPTSGGHENSIDAIRHVSTTYVIDQHRSVEIGDVHEEFTVVDIDVDDRDISDSNNGDEHVIAIQDNDTINDNTGVVNIEDSFNDGSTRPVDESNSADETAPGESSDDSEPSTDAELEPESEPEPISEPEPADDNPVLSEDDDPVLSGSDGHVDYDDAEDAANHADAPVM
jgi:hypothetical protein